MSTFNSALSLSLHVHAHQSALFSFETGFTSQAMSFIDREFSRFYFVLCSAICYMKSLPFKLSYVCQTGEFPCKNNVSLKQLIPVSVHVV